MLCCDHMTTWSGQSELWPKLKPIDFHWIYISNITERENIDFIDLAVIT